MSTSLRQFARDVWVLPRSIKLLGAGLGLGVAYGIVALAQAGAGNGLVIPLVATASAAVLLSLAIGWVARRIARVRSRGIAVALWERMTRRTAPNTKAAAEAQRELQQRWRDVHALLESKDYDYYALPWYLIVGASQSGKTTLVQRSGQEFPIGDQPIAEFGSTKNCNWFFTNKAILIDTAGRYVDHRLKDEPGPDERESEAEWKQFLALLRRHRPRTPLNGVILVVKVPDVLSPDATVRRRTGEMLRDAMRDVETHLGIRCPVYVMVTMCDRVLGFADFFRSLGGLTDRSLLGWSRGGAFDAPFAPDEFQGALGGLLRRLRELRLELLRDQRGSALDLPDTGALDRLYAFPEEFAALTEAVRDVLGVAFAPSAYHQTQFFRGVYFTSSLQKGAPFHEICRALLGEADGTRTPVGATVESGTPAPDSKTYFVADFFDEKVFREVGLVVPTARAERRRRVAARAGMVAAAASVLVVLGCAIRDVQRIGELTSALEEPPPPSCPADFIIPPRNVVPGIQHLAGPAENVDRKFASRWISTIDAVTTKVTAPLESELRNIHPDTRNLVRVLAASASELQAVLTDLLGPTGVSDLTEGCLNAIHEGLDAQRDKLRVALRAAHTKWSRQVQELNSSAASFHAGANRAAWKGLVLSRLAAEVADVGKRLGELVDHAATDRRGPKELSRTWAEQLDRLTAIKKAHGLWAQEDGTTPITASFKAVQDAIVCMDKTNASNMSLPTTDPDARSEDLPKQIADAESALKPLGEVVGFDPRTSPLANDKVWALAEWDKGLPPHLSMPLCSESAHPGLAAVVKLAHERVDELATHVGRALLHHFATTGLLPLAEKPCSTVDVAKLERWQHSQFARSSADKARAVFANLQRFANGNPTWCTALQSASANYEQRFKQYWTDELPDEVYKPSRPTTVEAAQKVLLRAPPLPGQWIHDLAIPTDTAPGRPSPPAGTLEAWVDELYAKCPWRDTKAAADALGALHDKWRGEDTERDLGVAFAHAATLRAPSQLRDGLEPLRKALQAYALDLQAALGVLAWDLFQRNWIAPEKIRADAPPFPLDGGTPLVKTDESWVIDPGILDEWLTGDRLGKLASYVWPALNPAATTYGLFGLGRASDKQRACFVSLMQLRELLICKEFFQVTLHSDGRPGAHSLREAGELRIVVDSHAPQRISPNNFARSINTMLTDTDVRFEFKPVTGDVWRTMPCTRIDAPHFRMLLFLYSSFHYQKASEGVLTCDVQLRARDPKDPAVPTDQVVHRWHTADGTRLTFHAKVDTPGMRFPDRLPDLRQADFFTVKTPSAD